MVAIKKVAATVYKRDILGLSDAEYTMLVEGVRRMMLRGATGYNRLPLPTQSERDAARKLFGALNDADQTASADDEHEDDDI